MGSVTNYTDYACPTGHYCLAGTSDPNQYPCDQGTFYNQTGATAAGDCFSCTRKLAQFLVPFSKIVIIFLFISLYICFGYLKEHFNNYFNNWL